MQRATGFSYWFSEKRVAFHTEPLIRTPCLCVNLANFQVSQLLYIILQMLLNVEKHGGKRLEQCVGSAVP